MKRIIAVDNEEYLVEGIKALLSSAGFEVKGLCNPLEVIRTIKEEGPFDLLITDIIMPKMTGMEIIRDLKEEDIKIPVLAMTGLPKDIAVECFENEGIENYLLKPFSGNELLAKAQKAMGLEEADAKES